MANIKSAMKRAKTTEKKTAMNKSVKSEMQTAIKKYKALIMANKPNEAEKALPAVIGLIDSAAAKGVIHKNAAARKVSNLSKMLSDLKSGRLTIAVKIDNKERARAKAAAKAAELEKMRAEAAARQEAKNAKPAKEDRKRKKEIAENDEGRIAKPTREEKAAAKAEAKAMKRKQKEEGVV
jgi:small subunit ribosomal protein S20